MPSESPVDIFMEKYDEYIASINEAIGKKEANRKIHQDTIASTSKEFNPINQKQRQVQRGREVNALNLEKQKAEGYHKRLQAIEEEVEQLRGNADKRSKLHGLLREKNPDINSEIQQLEHFKTNFLP